MTGAGGRRLQDREPVIRHRSGATAPRPQSTGARYARRDLDLVDHFTVAVRSPCETHAARRSGSTGSRGSPRAGSRLPGDGLGGAFRCARPCSREGAMRRRIRAARNSESPPRSRERPAAMDAAATAATARDSGRAPGVAFPVALDDLPVSGSSCGWQALPPRPASANCRARGRRGSARRVSRARASVLQALAGARSNAVSRARKGNVKHRSL